MVSSIERRQIRKEKYMLYKLLCFECKMWMLIACSTGWIWSHIVCLLWTECLYFHSEAVQNTDCSFVSFCRSNATVSPQADHCLTRTRLYNCQSSWITRRWPSQTASGWNNGAPLVLYINRVSERKSRRRRIVERWQWNSTFFVSRSRWIHCHTKDAAYKKRS